MIGRLQLSTEKSKEEENEGIVQLRILRTQVYQLFILKKIWTSSLTSYVDLHFQEAIVKILKMRKKISNAQLQTELVEILKNLFIPSKKMIKEQVEWLIEHRYMKRDEKDINTFIYLA